jgi:hypothetical protein
MNKLKRAFEILDSAMIEKFRATVDLKVQKEKGDFITVYLETKRSREDPHYPAVVWQARGFQISTDSYYPSVGHKLNAWVDKWFGDEIFKRACVELLSESFDVLRLFAIAQYKEVIVLDHSYGAQKKVTLKKLLGECVFSNSFSFEDTEGRFWLARDILAMC